MHTGKVGIQINVDLPTDIELVESLQEDIIWRQARGTATEILIVEDVAGPSEKVTLLHSFCSNENFLFLEYLLALVCCRSVLLNSGMMNWTV